MGTAAAIFMMLAGCNPSCIHDGLHDGFHRASYTDAASIPSRRILGGSERTFYRRGPIVDGLPVYIEERQIWNGAAWVPYYSEDGTDARFGIRKIREKSRE